MPRNRSRLSEVCGWTILHRAAVTLCLITCAAGHASATTVQVEYVGRGLQKNVKVNYQGNKMTLRAGVNNLLIDGRPFASYRVDLDHRLSHKPWQATLEPLTSINGGRQAAYLWKTFAADVKNKDQAAGLQLAIWEVLSDGGGELDFTSGNFRVLDKKGPLETASDYLAATPAVIASLPPARILHADQSQDFLVPEPAAWLFFLATAAGLLPFRRRP